MKKEVYYQPGYNERGEEIPDPTPMEVPVDFRAPPSLVDEIRRYVRIEMSAQARDQGEETFEEADDFWVDDDEHLSSEYELTDMQEEFILHPERFARVKEKVDELGDDKSESSKGERSGVGRDSGRVDDGVEGVGKAVSEVEVGSASGRVSGGGKVSSGADK